MDWIESPPPLVPLPPPSYTEALTPNVTVFEDRACKEVIKAKRDHKSGALIP